ncbi:Serine/threonine-protein kinase plk1 [Mortierella sp. GBA39]|nr:Serine/threonine-protein kinase plk1 [Mortierella sp. GBA39]
MNREEFREESQEKDDTSKRETKTEPKKPWPFFARRTGEEYAVVQGNFLGKIQHEVTMLEAAGKHTHLVKYFGTVEDPSGPNRGAITEEETRYFSAEIATGLAHLHDRGLIHCDLKPENIFFVSSMRIRIGDLGLAERFDLERTRGDRVGTDGYRAPEVVDLKPHTYALDIFSFGCIIYLLLREEEAWLTKRKKRPEKPETLLHMD